MQLLNNLGSIISAKDGEAASLPIYESALHAAKGLQLATPAAQSLPLALAQLHRNYGSALRKTGRLQDAAAAYDIAAKYYENVLSTTETPPAWLIQECATLECWQAAVLLRLHQRDVATTLMESFEARCGKLQVGPDSLARVTNTRLAAIEAFVDTAMNLLPDDSRAGDEALREAESQLAAAREVGGDAADAAFVEVMTEMDRCVRQARLRAGLCSGGRTEAWRVFSDCLDPECVDSIPLRSRLDLAVSLTLAETNVESAAVVASLQAEFATSDASKVIIEESLSALRRCGVPDDAITRVGDAIGARVRSEADEDK